MIRPLREPLERYLQSIWYHGSPPPRWLGWLEKRYRRSLGSCWHRPLEPPPRPVVVVGNLTAGGAGKTPVVIALARHLRASGRRVGVISRGYGGREPATAEPVSPTDSPDQSGDEPVLIAARSGASVWVCRHRDRALRAALEAGCDVVVSDDGLQHAALARSLEICVIDGQRGLGNERLLPAGPLRQPLERLDEVDLILVKGSGFRRRGAQVFELQPVGLTHLDGTPAEALSDWSGRTVDAVCGVAHPGHFVATLEALGINCRLRAFPDHHCYSASDIEALQGPVITTEKDAVKLVRLRVERTLRVLRVEADLPGPVCEQVDQHLKNFSGK
jgi:tetraacyldisaccharide 4'-kinase